VNSNAADRLRGGQLSEEQRAQVRRAAAHHEL
jgi:hypothetical protein